MKIYFYLFFFVLFCNSCNSKPTILENVNDVNTDSTSLNLSFLYYDTLKMIFVDTKCGEWGGDSKNIKVYKKYLDYPKEIILFDISETKRNCDSFSPDYIPERILIKNKIVASKQLKILLNKTIKEIFELKLKSTHLPSNSGAFSGLKTLDSTIYITIYQSPDWTNFNILFSQLKKL